MGVQEVSETGHPQAQTDACRWQEWALPAAGLMGGWVPSAWPRPSARKCVGRPCPDQSVLALSDSHSAPPSGVDSQAVFQPPSQQKHWWTHWWNTGAGRGIPCLAPSVALAVNRSLLLLGAAQKTKPCPEKFSHSRLTKEPCPIYLFDLYNF